MNKLIPVTISSMALLALGFVIGETIAANLMPRTP